MIQRLETALERVLWSSRLLVVIAVVASIVVAAGALVMATVDSIAVVGKIAGYIDPRIAGDARDELRDSLITGMVKAIDGYLIAAILLIFGLGLYELFVNKIGASSSSRLLQIRGLDDLKDRLAKAVLLVLIVEFFQYALQLTFTSALDLLYLAVGILLIGGAIFLKKDKAAAQVRAERRPRPLLLQRRYRGATEATDGAAAEP